MYTRAQPERYPYFAEQPGKISPEAMPDQLTGLVSRGYILWFAGG